MNVVMSNLSHCNGRIYSIHCCRKCDW